MRIYQICILVIVICNYCLAKSLRIGPVTSGISSWIQFPKGRDAFTAYNKMSFDTYFSYGKLKGSVGFPVQYTLDKKDSISVNGRKIPADTVVGRVAPGDLTAYVGIRIGSVEPRIGIILPLGYRTNSGVWLGSKNIIVKCGAGFSGDLIKAYKIRYGGECYFNYWVAGYPEIKGSLGKRGSFSFDPDIKFTMVPFKRWLIGIETLGGMRMLYPSWLKKDSFQGYELSASVVPHFIVSHDLSKRVYMGGKIGGGWSFKKRVTAANEESLWDLSGNIVNTGISAGFYFK